MTDDRDIQHVPINVEREARDARVNAAFVKALSTASKEGDFDKVVAAASAFTRAKLSERSFASMMFNHKAERIASGYLMHLMAQQERTACGQEVGIEAPIFELAFLNADGPYCDMCEACWLLRDQSPGVNRYALTALDDDNGGQYIFTEPQRPFINATDKPAKNGVPPVIPPRLLKKHTEHMNGPG